MDSTEWRRVREVFEQALDLPAELRGRYLREHAPPGAAARRELDRLLAHAPDGTDFLATPVARPARCAPEGEFDSWHPGAGERVGAFRIERLLGRGGMGSVYEARQEQPSRPVALKLMHVGLRSAQSRRRFEIETEILARLRHPGIATIHAAGVHQVPGGREVPYFAMEFVEGARDLVSFARERALDLRARVRLLRAVCDAVQHAHQKGVIHRDLKPGNVLVDAAGHVKVIDYGVARVAAPEEDPGSGAKEYAARARTRLTQAGFMLGTLQYMSPEQLAGSPEGLDTRSDVYALGLILYELISGRVPYDVQGRSIAEVVDQICERDPPPPSRHARDVPRELDWIALRALAKDRNQRYASVVQLSEDLERFLRDEPVIAGPPTRIYRLAKFTARNRALVALAALLLISLVAGIVSTTLARIEAEGARDAAAAEAERARVALRRQTAVVDMLDEVVGSVRPDRDGRDVTLFELLERRRPELADAFTDDPSLRASVLEFFVNAYFGLGSIDTAAELAEDALAGLAQLPAPDRIQSARLQRLLATVREYQSRLDEAQAAVDGAVRDLELAGDEADASDKASTMYTRAKLLNARALFADSAEAFRELIAYAERSLPAEDPLVPIAMGDLAALLSTAGEHEQAERWARRSLEHARRELGARSPWAALASMRLGAALGAARDLEQADLVLRESVELMAEVFGATHPNTVQASYFLALNLSRSGQVDEAERVARRALELLLREHGDDAIQLEASLRGALAEILQRKGERQEQIEQLRTAVERMESVGQAEHPLTVQLRDWLARIQDP